MQIISKWLGSDIDYQKGLDQQLSHVDALINGEGENVHLQLEHQPVYTIGRTRDQSSLGNAEKQLPHPVVEIGRGGQATYHGPGQLTGYPILNLRLLGKDLHAYVRALEEMLILTCRDFGVQAQRRDGLTGVWVENRKLASIGVGVRKWISMHGYAINITKESLSGFMAITPCGIDGVEMTCLENECGRQVSVKNFAAKCADQLPQVINEWLVK